ncbi:uncharacterized protein C8orf58 homolog [Tiliqua scincoides]|uniref:uncharacterized protein C8orf58 homolog n=1 Tax=Tiliqua scincoides TaxID=71010 RepID=UPI003462F84D
MPPPSLSGPLRAGRSWRAPLLGGDAPGPTARPPAALRSRLPGSVLAGQGQCPLPGKASPPRALQALRSAGPALPAAAGKMLSRRRVFSVEPRWDRELTVLSFVIPSIFSSVSRRDEAPKQPVNLPRTESLRTTEERRPSFDGNDMLPDLSAGSLPGWPTAAASSWRGQVLQRPPRPQTHRPTKAADSSPQQPAAQPGSQCVPSPGAVSSSPLRLRKPGDTGGGRAQRPPPWRAAAARPSQSTPRRASRAATAGGVPGTLAKTQPRGFMRLQTQELKFCAGVTAFVPTERDLSAPCGTHAIDSTWRPAENRVVLTSVSMYRKLQDPPVPKLAICLELEDKVSSEMGGWDQAGSPTEQDFLQGLPDSLGFLPTSSGRLLKSESEDSGVEMASSDHSPSTPVGSEKSFSLDCLDGFQPSSEDTAPSPPGPQETCPQGPPLHGPAPASDQAYHRNLSVSRKLAQVVQRSQRHRLPGRATRPLGQRPQSLEDLEGLKPSSLPRTIDGHVAVAATAGGSCGAFSDCSSTPEEQSTAEEVRVLDGPLLTMPGQGLRYLEHICQMLEKIAELQRANLRLQHQQQVMECRIRAQESENEVPSEEDPGQTTVESLPEDPTTPEMAEEEEDPSALGSWRSHHFRPRSASETVLRSPARNLAGNKPDGPRTAVAHSASSPSLLDQPDGGSQTLPSGMKLKNEHSHWSKVKVLINRMTRKSVRAAEPTQLGKPASGSGQCRTDIVTDKQGSHPRRHFLPTLGAKKHRSNPLSMR